MRFPKRIGHYYYFWFFSKFLTQTQLRKNKLGYTKRQPQRGGMFIETRQTNTLLAPEGRNVYRLKLSKV